MNLMEKLMELLYPPQANCLGCASPRGNEDGVLCEDCQRRLKPIREMDVPVCARCGSPISALTEGCRRCADWKADELDMARSCYVYAPPVDGLIIQFKYNGVYRLDEFLGRALCGMIRDLEIEKPDFLVPVPMHRRRLRQRGYNQAELLARVVEREMGWNMAELLRRSRYTRRQAKLSAKQRRHNLDGAFELDGDVSGLKILLIDDVLTTGATANRCARLLKRSGAAWVGLLSVARAAPGFEN